MSTPDRADIISRIRKLAKFTTTAGCTEAEAAAAAAKVASLIAEYDVTQDELTIRADARGCISDEFCALETSREDWCSLALPIGRLYHCRVWASRSACDPLGLGMTQSFYSIKFFGFPSDVAACLATCSLVHVAITSEAVAYRGGDRRSFRLGMIDRLNERLQAMVRERRNAPATGSALIVLKGQLVTEEFAKLNLRIGRARAGGATVRDAAAFAAGRAAGGRTDLGGAKITLAPRQLTTGAR